VRLRSLNREVKNVRKTYLNIYSTTKIDVGIGQTSGRTIDNIRNKAKTILPPL